MKRGIFGCVLLGLLLAFSLQISRQARKEILPIAGEMSQAQEAILREDYKKTAALTDGARAAWEKYRAKYSSLGDQQQIRNIDSLYDEVKVFLTAGETVHCSAACAELKNQLLALLEDQKVNIPNLF